MNTFVCRVGAKIISYNFGACQENFFYQKPDDDRKNQFANFLALGYNLIFKADKGKLLITLQKIGY